MDDRLRPPRERGVRLERRGAGWAAHGPGFYVWDEDARVLIDTACALAACAPMPEPDCGGDVAARRD